VFFIVVPDRAELAELSRRVAAGELRSIVGAGFPLAAGAEAFRAKRAGGVRGKAVLQVA
jgi:NADPH:quinone reductase-like Zn-dependent oxidoreductase